MTGVWLHVMSRWCVRLMVTLVLVGIGRLMFVAWEMREPTVTLTPTVFEDDRSKIAPMPLDIRSLRSRLAPSVPSDLMPTELLAAAGNASRPSRTQVYLVVNVAPDRAELLINGVSRGSTPYVGEVSCSPGSTLRLTVVPPKGMPKHFERICDRREIRIDESESRLERD